MSLVLAERRDAVMHLTLNRPERLNALDDEIEQCLLDHLVAADQEPGARCILLSGSGRAFCAGADVHMKPDEESSGVEQWRHAVELTQSVCGQLQRMSTPVVAAVHGFAIGSGASLALSADFLVVADDAQLAFPETSLGMFVSGAVTYRLPRLVGLRRATELLMLGQRFSGRQAADWGLAHEATSAAHLLATARELAATLAAKAPHSMARLKRRLGTSEGVEEALTGEAADMLAVMETSDFAEGISALREGRAPVLLGR